MMLRKRVQETAPEGRSLAITVYACATNARPVEEQALHWSGVVELFSTHDVRGRKDGRGFSFVHLMANSYRKNENVEFLSAAVLDIDDGTCVEELRRIFGAYEFLAVSSHSHCSTKPKYRLILPLTRDVSAAEWHWVWERVNAVAGGHGDPATRDPARFYYFPSCPPESKSDAFFLHNTGIWLDPDHLPDALPCQAARTPLGFVENDGAIGGIELSPDETLNYGDGERTVNLVRLIGSWISEDLSLEVLTMKARSWNMSNRPPLPDEKVETTCKSMWERYVDQPAAALALPMADPAPAQQPPPPTGNVLTFPLAPPTTRLFELSQATVGPFLAYPPPVRRYLLKDCLPLGKVGAIIAPGGTGKSQFVLQLAISVATGLPVANGAWQVGESGGVLALFAEDDVEELHRRIYDTVRSLRPYLEKTSLEEKLRGNLFVRSMVAENNLMTYVDPFSRTLCGSNYAEKLIATALDIPDLKLIIVDPASRFRGGIENAAEDTTRFVEALEFVSKQTKASLLVVHHANKQSMQGTEQTQAASRGSSAFSDGVRWQMNLSTMTKDEAKTYGVSEDQRYMYLSATMTKNNYAAPQPPVFLRRLDGGVLVKAELSDNEKREAQDTVLRIVEKIAESTQCFSARSFAESYGGKTNVFGTGENKLRGFVNQAIALGYLVKGSDRRGLLSVTELGRQVLSLPKKADSAIAR